MVSIYKTSIYGIYELHYGKCSKILDTNLLLSSYIVLARSYEQLKFHALLSLAKNYLEMMSA